MNTCEHEFTTSSLYLMRATSWEEPRFYAPSGTLPVEYCSKCGALRLSKEAIQSVRPVPMAENQSDD